MSCADCRYQERNCNHERTEKTVSTLPESDWINDDSIAFKEEQGSACYRLGDTVRVQCTKIDVNSGNVDFALVEEGQEAAAK